MKSIRLFLILGVLSTITLTAQNSNNPWLVSGGLNIVSLQDDFATSLNDGVMYAKGDFPSSNIGVPSLSVFRAVAGGLSLGTQFSLNSLKRENGGSGSVEFFAFDVALKYALNRDGKFSPYVKGGWGFSSFDAIEGGKYDYSRSMTNTYFGSVGLNLQLGEKWSIFAETSYRATQDKPEVNYLMHSVGVAIGFGSGDSDKDGVNDKKDKCPDIPGLKEFEGCPDTDEDGIPDTEDDCPETAGPKENNGCPDTDGDGVLDKDDACPEEVGAVELNGCPDTDGDGVANPDDECPEEAGDAENKGCPWPDTDGDGVADKDDDCPELAGKTENGCPEITDEVLTTMNQIGSNILFPPGSARIMGAKTLDALSEVKDILSSNPEGIVVIEGHASTDGSEDFNMKLSQKRADSVRDKLIELGIDGSRLETKAYGETKPLVGFENNRVKNRRVEFHRKQQ
ncbi:MAG: OmpA family protein [Flavobacteriaceae bacterium]